jgi:AraC-like DNA-binding protein
VHCIGVRLLPAAGAAVIPGAAKLRDRIVDLALLDARLSREFAAAARDFAAGSAAALWKLLSRHAVRGVDVRIATAVARIEAAAGHVRIDALARSAALSPRGFQQKFRAAVGLTPKEFARLTRLQATLRALDAGESSIAAVASDAGFADQAHVTRELRRATGLTPAKLRAELRRDREGDAAVRLAAAFVRGTSNVKDA